MADHSHPTASKKVLVAVGGQGIDAETVRLASRMTDPHGGKLYAVHIIEAIRRVQHGQNGAVRAEKRELPGDAVPGAPRTPGLSKPDC
jgi:K+-sensing histidine kinase KdpD